MAALKYKEEHNKVGYLLKPTGSDDYHQIIDFLSAFHIRYALTTNPIIFDSLVKQFWSMATLRAPELGPPAILATIDKTPYTITEELVRIRLQLANDGGIVDLPIPKIYSEMDNLGYVTKGKLTFFKNKFSPQWRFLVHTLLYCLSTNSGSWDQFGSLIDIALIYLSDGRHFNWSNYIFRGMHDHNSNPHETAADSLPTREDAPLGGGFHTSPPRSSQASSTCQPSGGKEDPITLTALSSVVLTLVQKVRSLKAKLHDHKRLFKDVIGNPCAPTAVLPGASDVPLATFAIPLGASDAPTGASTVLLGTSIVPAAASAVPADSLNVPVVPADSPNVPAGVSSKGKSLMVEEDIPIKARTFRQMEEDRLGEEAAKRLHAEEMAQMERERAEAQRKRQQEERQNRPMTLAQQKAYMRQYVKNQSNVIYNTGLTMAYVKSFTDEQLKQEFEKIRKVQSHSQIQAFSRTLKRPGPVLEEPISKRPKSPEAPTSSMPEVPISPAVTSPPSSRTRRKSFGQKHMYKPKSTLLKLDLDAPDQTFLKVVVNEDSDDEVWSVVVGWEDLMKLYGLVVQYYETHPIAGAGLLFWGDLQVLFNSQAGGKGSCVWQNQHMWEIRSWRLYTLSNVHVLETDSCEVLSMFTDVSYPLSVELIERMLMHKLEIDSDFVVAQASSV
nr:synaptobrevin, longin-like domain protein [Tanacetum cinerariifolium]